MKDERHLKRQSDVHRHRYTYRIEGKQHERYSEVYQNLTGISKGEERLGYWSTWKGIIAEGFPEPTKEINPLVLETQAG